MIGDTYHEGVIFHINLVEESYASIRHIMTTHIKGDSYTDEILSAYGITEGLAHETLLERVEHMCGDAIFKVPNYVLAQECTRQRVVEENLFLYHFDQRSRIKNLFEGTAYHAHELLYLFGNLNNEMNEGESAMARDFAAAWIRFANGVEPWMAQGGRKWMVWGPDSRMSVKSDVEDEDIREYTRMERVVRLGDGEVWMHWVAAVDALVNRRKF
jgi:carboxylesterase type B